MKTDAQLLREARADPAAFGEVYRRHADVVHSWLRARAGAAIAADLAAETFAQAALSLRRFRDEAEGSALPWLLGIARNLLLRSFERERVESRARRRLGMPESYEHDLDALDDRADAEQLVPVLAEGLRTLPPGQREAVELRVLRELSYDDVARELGCTNVAARLRVMRGLSSLTRILKGAVP